MTSELLNIDSTVHFLTSAACLNENKNYERARYLKLKNDIEVCAGEIFVAVVSKRDYFNTDKIFFIVTS